MTGARRSLVWVAVLVAAALAGLLAWENGTRAQAPTAQPRSANDTAAAATAPDRMIWDSDSFNPGDDAYPAVAYNSQDDEYLVVFEWENVGGGSGRDLASIIVDSNGQAAISPSGVATSNTYTDTRPAVAYNPTNNTYLAVWERSPGGNGAKDIWGAILHPSGSVSGTAFFIVNWSGNQQYPDVAYSTVVSRYLVVWEDHALSWLNGPNIHSASLNDQGADKDDYSVSGDVTGGQFQPAVAANNANGRWIVTWSDSRDIGSTGHDIYVQQIALSGGGAPYAWGVQVHIGDFWGVANAPDVAWGQFGSGDGEFLTVWSENSIIYGQRVQVNSALAGDVFTVSTSLAGSQSFPAVAFDSADEAWWVVWADNRDYG